MQKSILSRVRAHFTYAAYVLRHKWFVLLAGLRVGVPLWRLLVHDASKFGRAEWSAYVDMFYGGYARGEHPPQVKEAFDRAWLHHQNANDHHWQYWLITRDNPASNAHRFNIAEFNPHCGEFTIQEYSPTPYGNPRSWAGRDVEGMPRQYQMAGKGDVFFRDLCHIDPNKHFYSKESSDGKWSSPQHVDNDWENDAWVRAKIVAGALNRAQPIEMPENALREMVADWAGAGRAINGTWEVVSWYEKNAENIQLHPLTRARVEALLSQHFGYQP